MARNHIKIYHDSISGLELLSDAELGRLIKALLKYSAFKELTKLPGREKILFTYFKSQIDRDCQK